MCAQQTLRQMRRSERHVQAERWRRLPCGDGCIARCDDAFVDHARQHLVAALAGGDAVTIRGGRARRLRQRDKQRGFRKIERRWRLAEIGERGGAHAFEIAAEGRQRQIDRKGSRPSNSALPTAARAPSGKIWCRCRAGAAREAAPPASSASSRRRRCGPHRANCNAARTIANGSTPQWDRRNACPRRP